MALICIDIEASGLSGDSYPIEVAWRNADTGAGDSFLIDPASVDAWIYWDEFAEELHGIAPEDLAQEGIDAMAACRRLNDALAGRQVVCDAYDYDLFWLTRLFESQGEAMTFRLLGVDEVLDADQRIQYRLLSRAQRRRHRAQQDVDDLLELIQTLRQSMAV